MSNKSPLFLIIAVMASMLVVSCGSSKHTVTAHNYPRSAGVSHRDTRNFEIPKSIPPQSHALLEEAKRWIGTPYRYGGDNKHGMDCSGLVVTVYKSALDIKLPRSSSEQAEYCSPLNKNQLMPGDLLFFRTGSSKKISHVGIYVGDNKMVHSSTSSGVVVSDLSADYYVNTYAGAGSVEKYRAMISHPEKNTPPVDPCPEVTAPAGPVIVKAVAPVETVTTKSTPPTSVTDKKPVTTSVKTTPVKATPAKVAPVKTTPVKTIPVKTTPVKTVQSGQSKSEPTTEEARNSVLNSIIEQKIDSIMKP